MTVWIIAALVAFYIKGLCGFANTLVFNSILTFGNDNILVSPTELLLGLPTNLILAVKERKSIQKSLCIPLAMLVLVGSIPGVFLLKHVDATLVKVAFGIIIVLIGTEMLLREFSHKKHQGSKVVLIIIGILSGILCGMYGIGALLGAYVSRVVDDTKAFKANLSVVFFVENIFRIILYSVTGIITQKVITKVLILVPFMLIGLFAGIQCATILDEKIIKKLVIILLILSGIMLVVSNITG